MLGSLLSAAGSLMGGASKTEPYTVDQTPYWLKEFPEYKQGYSQVLADYMNNVYNKPYQPSSYMRRAEATDSPYLQKIQGQIDSQIEQPQAAAQQPETPQQDPAQMKMIADAQIGRQMYADSMTNPMFGYGIKGGRLNYQDKLGPDATDDDFAIASRMWNMPASEKAALHTPGATNASEVAKNVVSSLNTGNLKNTNNINIADMLTRLQSLGA